ncbi:SDR family oxidoreductase [Mucilaginibacter limnophilus]|uniref:SDR family oxidoreductase n=1 Tax=Mucilaginibacter limnophilus TaxID=1932778 RepID=A0A3S2XYA0_9SPHI|nr:SDR family oxidoreductase [Mucilaginibacter limnophilus]RVT97277.1 SDR family oxidoreductase [Mucilaginibacter limnophilus]
MFRLDNKVTVITGGGSGIGRAISTVFAQQGAKVYILDVDEKGAGETLADISSEGAEAAFKKCDITSATEVEEIINTIAAEAGSINILVNNAGIAHVGNLENTSTEAFERLLNVNVKGMHHVLLAAIQHLKKQGGVVLNMASIAASVGLADRFGYSVTKAAVNGITLSIAKDYLSYGIRCNSISPARVHTPFVDGFISKNYPGREKEMFDKLSATQPIGRMAKPVEIAWLALYLCSDEASFITGCDYPIDGGFITLNS